MYDKSGLVLRVETVINNPEEFRVRKQVLRQGKSTTEWVAMRKGVAYLFRYREVSLPWKARPLRSSGTFCFGAMKYSRCWKRVCGRAVPACVS